MTTDNVIAFRPYVVEVNVELEFYLKTVEMVLSFGPFQSEEAAQEWCLALEKEHKVIEGREDDEDAEALKQTGIPTKPFFCASVRGTNLPPPETMAKARGALIRPNVPAVDAHQIHLYALDALEEGVAQVRQFLNAAEE